MLGPHNVILEGQFAASPALLAPRLRSNELSQLLHDWQQHQPAAGGLPAATAFSPETLRYLLGRSLIYDVVPPSQPGAAPRFRYQHYGSHFSFVRQFDLSDRHVDEHPNPQFSRMAQLSLQHVCDTGLPVLSSGRLRQPDGAFYHVEVLTLPLGGADGVTRIVAGQFDHPIEGDTFPLRVNISDPLLLADVMQASSLLALLAEWRAACIAGGGLPARSDFPPERLRRWLGRVMLIERRPGDTGLRYRLVGSGLTQDRGFDITGRALAEHPDADFGRVVHWFALAILNLGRPGWYRGSGFSPRGSSLNLEGLGLPLRDDCILAVQLPRP